jgi:hypothetical protein
MWYKENCLYEQPLLYVQREGNYDILLCQLSVFKNVGSYLFVTDKCIQRFGGKIRRQGATYYI